MTYLSFGSVNQILGKLLKQFVPLWGNVMMTIIVEVVRADENLDRASPKVQ